MVDEISVNFQVTSDLQTKEHDDAFQSRTLRGSTKVRVQVEQDNIHVVKDFHYEAALHPFIAKQKAAKHLAAWALDYLGLINTNVSFISSVHITETHGTTTITATLKAKNTGFQNIEFQVVCEPDPHGASQEALSRVRSFLLALSRYSIKD